MATETHKMSDCLPSTSIQHPNIERVLLVKSYLDAAAVVLKKESDSW